MNFNQGVGNTPEEVTLCCSIKDNGKNCPNPLYIIFQTASHDKYYGYCKKDWGSGHSGYTPVKNVETGEVFNSESEVKTMKVWNNENVESVNACCDNNSCPLPLYVVFSNGYSNYGHCEKHYLASKNYYASGTFKIKKMIGESIPEAVTPSEFRTQKAIGLKALRDFNFNTPAFDIYGVESFGYESPYDREYYNPEVSQMYSRLKTLESLEKESKGAEAYHIREAIIQLKEEVNKKKGEVTAKQLGMFQTRAGLTKMVNKFVRPCPMVPRHGFVDSRPVKSVEDAEKLLEETMKAEDKAEFIIMPFIKAEYSGIWTNGKLVIGTGNDGATAGHTSRLIPALGIPCTDEYTWKMTLKKGRVTETPYVELLWAKKYDYQTDFMNYFVQLRNGPSLPDTIDYIPEEMTVKNIVLAEGDLLEWETKAKNFPEGTVIYHPEGSLASHYAVHAVLNHLPVMISRKPELNEVLKPNTEVKTPDINSIRNGFYLGATQEMTYEQAANAMLVGCHSTSVWLGRQDTLLGFAMGCAYRLTITAVLGEYRHEPGRKRKPKRESVYSGVWHKILSSATRTRFMKALDSFQNNSDWGGSFGGKKWYVFGSYAASIFNSILDGNVTASLENLNKCVNAVHNSGWGFDKFVHKTTLDIAAMSPSVILLRVAPRLYDTLILSERDRSGGEWFKGKHHVEVEELELEAAERDEKREEERGTESNHLYKESKVAKLNKEEYVKENGYAICECHNDTCDQPCGTIYHYEYPRGVHNKTYPPCMPCKKHEHNFKGCYTKFTPEETAAYIKRHKVVKLGTVTKASVTMDSSDQLWLKFEVNNQAETGQDYQLITVDIKKDKINAVKKLIYLCQDKKEGNYIPLTIVATTNGYLHVGPDDVGYSWSDHATGKGYLLIEIANGKIGDIGYGGLKG